MSSASTAPSDPSRFCCVVMGVSGCGKSSVGAEIARQWQQRRSMDSSSSSHSISQRPPSPTAFIDGDDFHSASNKAKMASGTPLTDADRAGWLSALAARVAQARSEQTNLVLACSALKPAYRQMIFGLRHSLADDPLADSAASVQSLPLPPGSQPPRLFLVHLDGSRSLLAARLRHRTGHFAKADLLDSQLATLVAPTDAECEAMGVQLCTVDLDAGDTAEQQARRVVEFIGAATTQSDRKAASNKDAASSSSAHLLYRDALQSVLSWLPLSALCPASLVCVCWSASVRGECAARPLRQAAELKAALSMMHEEASATAGASRLTRLIRSVPAEDWPRSAALIAAQGSAAKELASLLSQPAAAVKTAATLALVAAIRGLKAEGSTAELTRAARALAAFICAAGWTEATELMSDDERAQCCCAMLETHAFGKGPDDANQPLFGLLLHCSADAASDAQLRAMFKSGAIPPLCALLQSDNEAMLLQSLAALSRHLAVGKADMRSAGCASNAVADAVDAIGATDTLEHLQEHDSEALYAAVVDCLKKYFVPEDDV